MVASAHGTFRSLIRNPVLSERMGGVNVVTFGDCSARASNNGNKNSLQRVQSPVFQTVIELQSGNLHSWAIHRDVEEKVDQVLRGKPYEVEVRTRDAETGRMFARKEMRLGEKTG